ncbi:unnamed protein product [Rodentolepis nana]|uniref:RNase H type-1 domain-containing protein n=1 Tax=Rodentolepis nana TaxID=102285 RepID=A0A0R3TXH6_RODNA|nr:unnamed protein product [Rodentolepis nana]
MNSLADTDVVYCTQLLDFFGKSNTPPEQMRSLAETINVKHTDQWIQVFTDGSYMERLTVFTDGSYIENQTNVGVAVYTAGSAIEGDIEAVRIALCQLCCLDTKFTKAVILSDSVNKGMWKTLLAAEIGKLNSGKRYELLGEKNKTVVQQWIPGHCGIKGNELADTLTKPAKILKRNQITK